MRVHFILSGETLESISEDIQLENPKYLKEFHNTYCAKEDIIYDQLIPRKKLLIPDYKKISEYNSKNDAPFKNPKLNPVLPFNPENFSKIFTVTSKETEDDGISKKNNILTYNVSLKWVEKTNDFHIFHLFKNNFSNDNGSMMADLASASIKALNPIIVKTDHKGNILQVSIKDEIYGNFAAIKENLLNLFPDQYARIYLDEFELAVSDKNIFNKRMKEDIFIRNYFTSIRNEFINGKSFLKQTIGEDNIPIEVVQKVKDANYDQVLKIGQIMKPQAGLEFSGEYDVDTVNGLVKKIEIHTFISRYGVKTNGFFSVE